MADYYASVVGSVFKFDSNGNLLVDINTGAGYDGTNDWWKVNVENMPAFVFDSNGYLEVNLSASVAYDDTNDLFKVNVFRGEENDTYWNTLPLVSTEIADAVENAVTGESVGSGDGSTTSFSYTAVNLPIVPKSVSISYTIGGTAYTATDDGEGNVSGTDVSGTINYDTGALSLTFTTAPDSGTSITMDYSYYTNGSGVDVSLYSEGFVHIKIEGVTSSTVYITPALNGVKLVDEQLVYQGDVDEMLPVQYYGGTLSFYAYRTGTDYVTLTIEGVRR